MRLTESPPRMMRPLEPDELLEICDLAGEARVCAIETLPGNPARHARLRFTRIVKGQIFQRPGGKADDTVWVRLRDQKTMGDGGAILGDWNDRYPVGERVFTYLCWAEREDGWAYRTTWWNAVTILPPRGIVAGLRSAVDAWIRGTGGDE